MSNQHGEKNFSAKWMPAFSLGLVIGGLVGAAVMLLLAPRTGKQTRSQIQKQGAKLRHQAFESMEDVTAEAGDMAHQFTDNVQRNVQKGVGDLQHQAQDMLNDVRK